ncbi:ABC transporter permease [Palleronia pelagia]|uniref:Ribose transport system permease protein n=1 Tax=Palleronia pelagia TaxID=387096 RepID=A0A1H8KZL7_9RHOB|nr:ABC transporter permease [Palleronia pelagia]SEN98343.1 ribose transport system permease protein [Palleronia pelagia]
MTDTVQGAPEDRDAAATDQRASGSIGLVGRILRSLEIRMLGLALLLAVILSLLSPFFLTERNIFNILDQSVVIGIVAVGMTFVILTGGIDLSVGAVFGLTGIILAQALQVMPIPLAIPAAVATGAGIGLFSGLLIAVFGLAPFVVTLGVMAIGRSLSFILSGQRSISGLPPELDAIVYSTFLGIPANVLFLLGLYLLAWVYLTYTKGGRTIYAIGSNKEAARAAGLSTMFYSILPYVVAGALSAVAVTFSLAQIMSADPLAGNQMELDAIAAVVIGGASLYGGRGSIIGTLLGVLIMVMIRNGLNLMGVSPFWQGTAIGSIIIIALLAERLINWRSNRN